MLTDLVRLGVLITDIRSALNWLGGLPEGDDYDAVHESLEEALNAAESWAMDPSWNDVSAAQSDGTS